MSTWLILIFALLFVFFIPYDYDLGLSEKVENESLRIEGYALSAAQAALSASDMASDYVFESKTIREDVVDTYYKIYAKCINLGGSDYTKVKYNIPCIIMADNDGYYVAYTQWTNVTQETAYTDIITEKQPYVKQYGNFIVIYQLNDLVTVSDMGGMTEYRIKGTYETVKKELESKYGTIPEYIKHFEDEELFNSEKHLTISKKIEHAAEYYINTHNEFFNKKDVQYKLSLPVAKEEKTSGLLDSPSVIGFVQGAQGDLDGKVSNIYAYVAADLEKEPVYVITKDEDGIYYHKATCVAAENAGEYGTVYECAKAGATPHDCVFFIGHESQKENE